MFDTVVDIDDPNISVHRMGITNEALLDPLPYTPFLPQPSRPEHDVRFTHLVLEVEPCRGERPSRECGDIELWKGGFGLMMDGTFHGSAPVSFVAQQARWFLENITNDSPDEIDAKVESFLQSRNVYQPHGSPQESRFSIQGFEAPRLSSLYRDIVDAAGGLETDTILPVVDHGHWRIEYQVTMLSLRSKEPYEWRAGFLITDTAWFKSDSSPSLKEFENRFAEVVTGLGLEVPPETPRDQNCRR